MDGEGRGLVSWLESTRPFRSAVRLAEEGPDGNWSSVAASRALSGGGEVPRLAAAPMGKAAVLCWRHVDGGRGEILASVRGEDGTWSHPGASDRLSFPPDAYEPEVAVGADGEGILTWIQETSTGRGVSVARRPPGAQRFVRPSDRDEVLSPPIEFSNFPEVVVNRLGGAMITWYQSTGGPLNAFVSERKGPTEEFSRPGPGDHLSVGVPHPEGEGGHFLGGTIPALDGRGHAAVAWTQPVAAREVAVFLALRGPGRRWAQPIRLGGDHPTRAGVACCPRTVAGAEGDLYVVWKEALCDTSTIYLVHRDSTGQWLTFGSDPFALSPARQRVGSPVIAMGDGGSVLAAWIEESPERARIIVRKSAAGLASKTEAGRWDDPAVLGEGSQGTLHSVSVAIGGPAGRAIVAWVQSGTARVAVMD